LLSRKAVLREFEEYGLTVPEIVEKYCQWVSEDQYMIMNRIKNNIVVLKRNEDGKYEIFKTPKEKKPFTGHVEGKYKILNPKYMESFKSEVFAVKCSKRGNDVYRHRVYRRFKGLASLAEKTVFFNPKDRGGKKKTRALFVTLTYDTKRCSYAEAWRNLGVEFNRFMAYDRKKFGKVSSFRVFESSKKGYPHIHCILLFEEKEFKVFRDRRGQFRIKEKGVVAAGWHSHTDVQAMSSLGRGLSYLKKYLLKCIDAENKDSKALKTLALSWLFNKRAFSISGKFRQMLTDLIKTKHNSNHKRMQITLEGEIVQEYIYYVLGFVPADVVRLKKDLWFSKLGNEQITSIEKFLKSKKRVLD